MFVLILFKIIHREQTSLLFYKMIQSLTALVIFSGAFFQIVSLPMTTAQRVI